MALPRLKDKETAVPYKHRNKVLATWVPTHEQELFATIASSYGITSASYLRAVVSRVLREEVTRSLVKLSARKAS